MDPLSRDDEVELVRRAKDGDAGAESRLVMKHMGLVKSRMRRWRGRGVDDDDLIQIGLMAVLETVRRFEPMRGCRVSTLATWRIDKAMGTAVAESERERHLTWCGGASESEREDSEPGSPMLLDDVNAAVEACLTAEERAVVELRYRGAKGLSYPEIAAKTGRSKDTVGRANRRALQKIKRHLEPAA